MQILVSGSSGLIGSALVVSLPRSGHTVGRMIRDQARARQDDVVWTPETGQLDPAEPGGLDAVVHLAGESIADAWTARKKARIRDSRAGPTRRLAESLAGLKHKPRVLVSASAIGYYGDRGGEELREPSAPGAGFLADVCREWEDATRPAAEAGIRTAMLRFGVVLSPHGGMLAQVLPIFRMGMAGPLGSGRQYVSWIALDDAVRAIEFVVSRDDLSGPINVVAPEPVTNTQFTKALAGALGRPAVLRAPAFALRLAFGQRADELLLASARVIPARLAAAGFEFQYPRLQPALAELLGQ